MNTIEQGNIQSRSLINEFDKVHSSEIAIDNDKIGIGNQSVSIKIDYEDIKDEIEYWENAVVCYVVGANPPFPVMEGFLRRIWGKFGIDKIGAVGKGFFLVRLNTKEQRDAILNGGFQFFDKKPMIVKAWHQDLNLQKENMKRLPIWIQLPQLDLKYWGESYLYKLVAGIGTPLKLDQATKAKYRLNFARILVEVGIDQYFPDSISFENEKGEVICQAIGYEWKPISCGNCHGLGHETAKCFQEVKKKKKVWVVKEKPEKNADGFTLVTKGGAHPAQATEPVVIHNSFEALEQTVPELEIMGRVDNITVEDEQEADEDDVSQEGEPPDIHG